MNDKIKLVPFRAPPVDLLKLTESCRAEIEKTFALQEECFLPQRSRPITDLFGCEFTVDPSLSDDTMIVQTGKETAVFKGGVKQPARRTL